MQRIGFPTFTTPLIGRDADVAALVTRLRQSPTRFTTLLGPSGTGKTRLSIQIADRLHHEFRDGVAFISLATLADPDLVIPTIARTFGLAERGSLLYEEALVQFLRDKQCLIVLDNMEQVIAAAPHVIGLLSQTEQVRVLVTSQQAANDPNEEVIPIPPLAIPLGGGAVQIETISMSPAVALFLDRIRRVRPEFMLDQANALHIVEICRRLRGLPLAIELVAAHSDTLRPADLLLLLRNYLPAEQNVGAAPAPEQVLHPVLDWCISYSVPAIRWLLPRLGVFQGEWTLSQVQLLANEAPNAIDIAKTLDAMVAKGLLLNNAASEEPTYTMLDTIRQYAARQLKRDPKLDAACHAAHAKAFQQLALDIDAGIRQGQGMVWRKHLNQAMPNIRSALQWLYQQQRYSDIARFIASMVLPLYQQGYIREGLSWIARVGAHAASFEPQIQLHFGYANGLLSYAISDYPSALQAYGQALPHAKTLNDLDYQARLLNNQGMIYGEQTNYAAAREVYEAALAIRQQQANVWGEAIILNNLGSIAQFQGDHQAGRDYFQASLAIYQQLGDLMSQAVSFQNIATTQLNLDEYAEAEQLFRESIAIHRQSEESSPLIMALYGLGLALLRQASSKRSEAGDVLHEAVTMAARLNVQRSLAIAFEGFAEWLAPVNPQHAAYLVGGAASLRQACDVGYSSVSLRDVANLREQLDQRLGQAARQAAEATGEALSQAELLLLVTQA
ncbi:ATP-binding protein [Herpetosiphon giganteus]|uniref:ATP-binding protein n=1 Tax=Herpetosiphon giganteus TaxID=2029754 RepID=UPI0019577E9D|nr:tetratricopeptide repeat protein [Herpetosiphon giganteus]MBM7846698.1 putative ATPase [Herpetosiphon giganteus]